MHQRFSFQIAWLKTEVLIKIFFRKQCLTIHCNLEWEQIAWYFGICWDPQWRWAISRTQPRACSHGLPQMCIHRGSPGFVPKTSTEMQFVWIRSWCMQLNWFYSQIWDIDALTLTFWSPSFSFPGIDLKDKNIVTVRLDMILNTCTYLFVSHCLFCSNPPPFQWTAIVHNRAIHVFKWCQWSLPLTSKCFCLVMHPKMKPWSKLTLAFSEIQKNYNTFHAHVRK